VLAAQQGLAVEDWGGDRAAGGADGAADRGGDAVTRFGDRRERPRLTSPGGAPTRPRLAEARSQGGDQQEAARAGI
jgi:hypothetical protein